MKRNTKHEPLLKRTSIKVSIQKSVFHIQTFLLLLPSSSYSYVSCKCRAKWPSGIFLGFFADINCGYPSHLFRTSEPKPCSTLPRNSSALLTRSITKTLWAQQENNSNFIRTSHKKSFLNMFFCFGHDHFIEQCYILERFTAAAGREGP